MRGHAMLSDTFTDNFGSICHVGDVVMWDETFVTSDTADKYYVVVNVINYGDMVEMTEISDWCLNKAKDGYESVTKINDETISVEPYKIVAI
jgi:hypothetical protein